MNRVLEYVEANRERYVEELKAFLRIPSVSAQSQRQEDCWQAARFLVEQFERMGLEVSLRETPGNPVVLAKYHKHPNRPTVLIYGHYDVQPEDPVDLWSSPPFEPRVEGGNIYARGATDDKGQVFAHVKAVEALLQSEGELPVNVTFLIEGEEEIASKNLESFIEQNLDELHCDVAVISDSSQYGPGQPAIVYGLRGIVTAELRVTGANQDLHSGSFGGAVPNPAFELCRIIAQLKDGNDRVRIPGFYDEVIDLTPDEREAFAQLLFDEEAFGKSVGVKQLKGEAGYTALERKWARPTLEINGIFGGYSGEGSKTVIPSWAEAKFSMRLVPRQEPHTIVDRFEAFVKQIADDSVAVEVSKGFGCGGVLVPEYARFMNEAKTALTKGFGTEPVLIREGGTIPIVLTLQEKLGVNTLLIGLGLPDDNMHAPNEKFSLDCFHRGIQTSVWFLQLC